jgi:hypothetical protein
MHHRLKRRNKHDKTKKKRMLRGGGSVGSPSSSPEVYDDAELDLPVTSTGIIRQPQNSMNWLGPFKHNIVQRLGQSRMPVGMNKMTKAQRKFLVKLATRKRFGDKIIQRLVGVMPGYDSRIRNKLTTIANKRITNSIIADSTAPYGLERIIHVDGNPGSAILDSDGNIVVSSNKQSAMPVQRIHVFRYNDGAHLKSMHATSNSIGGLVFYSHNHNDELIFSEDRHITFLNYHNEKRIRPYFKPSFNHNSIAVDANGNIIIGIARRDRSHQFDITYYGLVMIDNRGREIDNVFDDKFRYITYITFDPQGRLVVILNSNEYNEIQIYNYTPRQINRPFILNRPPWKVLRYNKDVNLKSVAFDTNGNMLVAVKCNIIVIKYNNLEPETIGYIDCSAESDTRQCSISCVTVAPNGDILVCDINNMCIKIFTNRL